MLEKIIIKNVNSIDTCEIDFKKDKYKFLEDNVNGTIVNPVAIYGHNGSGKTSVIKTMDQLVALMNEPAANLRPFIVNNFLFDTYNRSTKKNDELVRGSVELFFKIDSIEYNYFIQTSSFKGIVKEYLKVSNDVVFERDLNNFIYRKKNRKVQDVSTLISTLRSLASSEINDDDIQKAYTYVSSYTIITPAFISRGAFVRSRIFNDVNFLDLLVNKSEEVKEILKGYNEFPIYSIVKKPLRTANIMETNKYFIEIEGKDFKGELPFEFISEGMKNQSVMLSILLSMPENGIIFIDELEQALHPSAIKSFLNVIKSKNIQVFFSSHNTYILQLLRPDQIYFAKWYEGKSKYCRLSNIYQNIREVNNIEKMYLSAMFDEAINGEE